jgi:hypothetical protein
MFDHYHKGLTYCRPEAYYFWCYYFFMNFIWIVIPGSMLPGPNLLFPAIPLTTCAVLLYSSIDNTAKAFRAVEKMSKTLNANGQVKKSL